MSKAHRQHPLSAFLSKRGDVRVADAGVRVTVEPYLSHINVRGRTDDSTFVAAMAEVLRQEMPLPNRVSRKDSSLYWLGPEEFLAVAAATEGSRIVSSLRAKLQSSHYAVTDVSGGQVLLTLTGSATRDLLSKASTLDLGSGVFLTDHCAHSTFAKSAALYALRDDAPTFELIVRRSFADYIGEWLFYAGQEFGIVFCESSG